MKVKMKGLPHSKSMSLWIMMRRPDDEFWTYSRDTGESGQSKYWTQLSGSPRCEHGVRAEEGWTRESRKRAVAVISERWRAPCDAQGSRVKRHSGASVSLNGIMKQPTSSPGSSLGKEVESPQSPHHPSSQPPGKTLRPSARLLAHRPYRLFSSPALSGAAPSPRPATPPRGTAPAPRRHCRRCCSPYRSRNLWAPSS